MVNVSHTCLQWVVGFASAIIVILVIGAQFAPSFEILATISEQTFYDQEYDLWEGIETLLDDDHKEYFIGIFILLFSGIWPHVKQLTAAVYGVLLSKKTKHMYSVLYWLEVASKWSMVDVFFVALCMTCIDVETSYVQIYVLGRWGVYLYGSVILFVCLFMSLFKDAAALLLPVEKLQLRVNKEDQEEEDTDETKSLITDGFQPSLGLHPGDEEHPLNTVDPRFDYDQKEAAALRRNLDSYGSHSIELDLEGERMSYPSVEASDKLRQHFIFRSELERMAAIKLRQGILIFLSVFSICTMVLCCCYNWYTLNYDLDVTFAGVTLVDQQSSTKTDIWACVDGLSDHQYMKMLIVLFVIAIPITKMLGAFIFLIRDRKYVLAWFEAGVPWDMRDVFIVTMAIFSVRIESLTSTLGQGFLVMTVDLSPGFWLCVASVVLDYLCYILAERWRILLGMYQKKDVVNNLFGYLRKDDALV